MTPAQASGVPDFVTDVPVQGPTDPGIRAHDCWYVQNRLPARPACVDCKGPIPMWAQTSGVSGERLSYGGQGALGFALAKAGDPDVWTQLNLAQQTWVMNTLTTLNNIIFQGTNTTCPTWGPSITAAGGCFQGWFNANAKFTNPDGSPVKLRTDGVFDQDTLNALTTTAATDPVNFPTPFPAGAVTSAAPTTSTSKLSTGKMVGIAAVGAVALGGIAYAFTHKKPRRRR